MRHASTYHLAQVVAVVFTLAGFYYLIPNLFHPLTTDTASQTVPHLRHAVAFGALALVALILGQFVRPRAWS